MVLKETCRRAVKPPGGFTLLELLIVVVILGILAAIAVPRFTLSAAATRRSSCAQNAAKINAQVERWRFATGAWPKDDLSDIAADENYFPGGIPQCPVDGSPYGLDSTIHRVGGHTH